MIHPNIIHRRNTGSRLLAGALALAGLLLAAGPATANAQQYKELLNRFVQSDNDAAMSAFTQGRSFVDAQQWQQAASTFDRFVVQYPKDKNMDAALYWLAYARNRQGHAQDAEATLSRLLVNYPGSRWADDAKALRVEVLAKLGKPVTAIDEKDDTIALQIIALKTLCENDRLGCSARVADVLRANKPAPLKEAAIILLGRYGGNEAVPALIQMSRTGARTTSAPSTCSARSRWGRPTPTRARPTRPSTRSPRTITHAPSPSSARSSRAART
jgi:tetratricopeptide (TPR) repeat protein